MRKTKLVQIAEDNRDRGKCYFLTEMSAFDTEQWGWRAMLAASNGGVEIPSDVLGAGIAGVAVMGLRMVGAMKFADAAPLMDEMLKCVQVIPDFANHPNVMLPFDPRIEGQVEEAVTLLRLRADLFELHTGFSIAGAILRASTQPATGSEA
jgi:hypothetical protein